MIVYKIYVLETLEANSFVDATILVMRAFIISDNLGEPLDKLCCIVNPAYICLECNSRVCDNKPPSASKCMENHLTSTGHIEYQDYNGIREYQYPILFRRQYAKATNNNTTNQRE